MWPVSCTSSLYCSRCTLKMKRDALYVKWLNYSVTVRRSDNANEKKMFVGFLRRFLLATMVCNWNKTLCTSAVPVFHFCRSSEDKVKKNIWCRWSQKKLFTGWSFAWWWCKPFHLRHVIYLTWPLFAKLLKKWRSRLFRPRSYNLYRTLQRTQRTRCENP